MGYSKRRLKMGEEKWEEYQSERKKAKVVRWRKRAKRKLIAYKGGKCIVCGYDKDVPSVYDFHHRDPETKKFAISKGYHNSIEKLKKEADKCDLLCCRCHQELHFEKDYKDSHVF